MEALQYRCSNYREQDLNADSIQESVNRLILSCEWVPFQCDHYYLMVNHVEENFHALMWAWACDLHSGEHSSNIAFRNTLPRCNFKRCKGKSSFISTKLKYMKKKLV